MKISDVILEASVRQMLLEDSAYNLLLKIRKSKKNGTFDDLKNGFIGALYELDKQLIISMLGDDETKHINNWINSSKKILGIK